MNSRRKTGFTLLELLVVISIIAILAVSLTPAFSRAREAARRTTCGQNMSQIHKAITMYETDYSQYPAIGVGGSVAGSPMYNTGHQQSLNLLYRQYCDDVRVFSCPSKKVDLSSCVPSTAANGGDKFTTTHTSYGYSPGHTSINSRVVILADRIGSLANSDNHGVNAGENMLSAGGAVQFFPQAAAGAVPPNDLGMDDGGNKIGDTNIFQIGGVANAAYYDWDSDCE